MTRTSGGRPVGASVQRSRPSSSRRCGCATVSHSAAPRREADRLAVPAPQPAYRGRGWGRRETSSETAGAPRLSRDPCVRLTVNALTEPGHGLRDSRPEAGANTRVAAVGLRTPNTYTSTGTQAAWDCVLPPVRSAFHVKPTWTIAVGKAWPVVLRLRERSALHSGGEGGSVTHTSIGAMGTAPG
jgi:hypothetical protein